MFKSRIHSQLDAQIESALKELNSKKVTDDDYGIIIERVSKLHKLKSEEKIGGPKPPSVDTMLVVAANVFGILWLARYEKDHVIKSQSAFRMILRP